MSLKAQQDPFLGSHNETHAYLNPGYVGHDDFVNALFLNRTQWAGFNSGGEEGSVSGNPVTSLLTAETSFDLFGLESGLGISVVSKEIGFQNDIEVKLSYAYKHELEIGTLGVGFSAGFIDHQISGTWESVDISGVEPLTYTTDDNLLPQGENNNMVFDLGLGAYLKNNRYELGISVTHLLAPTFKYGDGTDDFVESNYLRQHFYITGKYNIQLPDPLFELHPSFIYRTDLAELASLDVGARIVYKNKVWGGAYYSLGNGIFVNIGTELINELRVGYQLEVPTTEMFSRSFGSHEVFVTYSFDIGLKRDKKYKSVRYL